MVNWGFTGDVDEILLTSEDVSDSFKKCVLDGFYDASGEFSGGIGTRIGSIFVILVTSTLVTVLPVLCKRRGVRVPLYFYLFARYFGAGVIIATGFVHLMDPAYSAIGPNSCVGGWGNWQQYSWPPALMLGLVFMIFLIELASEVYVDRKYGNQVSKEPNVEKLVTGAANGGNVHSHGGHAHDSDPENIPKKAKGEGYDYEEDSLPDNESFSELSFRKQIAAFLMLEIGVIFHSIIIGLNLGSSSYEEFKTLYIVLVFHQSFEGLGIGARLSAIDWPKDKSDFWAYAMCAAYGLVTPIAIAIGLGVRESYAAESFTATVVSGILDSLSAGILIYTGMVELLARDFVMNEEARDDLPKLLFNLACMMVGCLLMAILGKWA